MEGSIDEDPRKLDKSRTISFIDLPSLQKYRPFGLYNLLVSDIVTRNITYTGDMLNAFKGIQKQLSLVIGNKFCGRSAYYNAPSSIALDR